MRGKPDSTSAMFCYTSPEGFVPKEHPLRAIKAMVDAAMKELSGEFDRMYSHTGRPSIPPERLLKALLLQMLYSIRSERQLSEQVNYNILFRYFLDMALDEKVWDPIVYCHNRDRLLKAEIAGRFFETVLGQARKQGLLSVEHFSVDGTLRSKPGPRTRASSPRMARPPGRWGACSHSAGWLTALARTMFRSM